MSGAVVEQELTARRGRKRTKLRLRVFAPTPWERNFRCKLELTADGEMVFPHRADFPGIGGADSLQAFMLALQFAAFELLRFEVEHGMQIDAWEWMSLIPLVANAPVDPYMRGRINEIQATLRTLSEQANRELEAADARRKPRSANRKPRTAADRRSRSRSRSRSQR